MKRLAIFSFYDCEGHADTYINCLLQDIAGFVDKLVIVCNGSVDEDSLQLFQNVSAHCFIRENIGYDAGGYKDMLISLKQEGVFAAYEECILLNNTFFAFFYPLQEMFDVMEQKKDVDFWGITRHPKGQYQDKYCFKEHIQAYFLVIRSRMFDSADFFWFWRNMDYAADYHMAVRHFEIAFTEFFTGKGFVGDVYCDLLKIGIAERYGINPYLFYGFELIAQMQCPVLKIKSICIENSESIRVLEAIDYLQKMQLYDTELIWQYLIRSCKNGSISTYFDFYRLERFCRRFSCLYVYGNGVYGKWIKMYLYLRHFPFGGFVVTRKTEASEEETFEYAKLEKKQNAGWILALNEKNTREVLQFIGEDILADYIFTGNKE